MSSRLPTFMLGSLTGLTRGRFSSVVVPPVKAPGVLNATDLASNIYHIALNSYTKIISQLHLNLCISMARSGHQKLRRSPLPTAPPARLLGSLLGRDAPQLPPNITPRPRTGKEFLLVTWVKPGNEAPAQLFLPCSQPAWTQLIDHKEALEGIGLHPRMKMLEFTKKGRSKKGSKWKPLAWDKYIQARPNSRFVLRRTSVEEPLWKWDEYMD
ncbi:hypothetical protein FB451DRAFT_1290178 [Mycena latifolia]|nr:hypothetical protein FB451DRAFT_1290178 [Mycena latifolia]